MLSGMDWQLTSGVFFVAFVGVAAIWVWVDASNHTSSGCIWATLTIFFCPIVLPVYVFMRLYTSRRAPQRQLNAYEEERESGMAEMRRRFGSDIERARYLEHIAKEKIGTLYEPGGIGSGGEPGYPHFTDQRAEALLREHRYEEAFTYLSEMFDVATGNHDTRAEDTYRHYLGRIPAGAVEKKQHQAEAGPRPIPKNQQPRRNQDRPEVPF